jgi:hypothetical protein
MSEVRSLYLPPLFSTIWTRPSPLVSPAEFEKEFDFFRCPPGFSARAGTLVEAEFNADRMLFIASLFGRAYRSAILELRCPRAFAIT